MKKILDPITVFRPLTHYFGGMNTKIENMEFLVPALMPGSS